MKYIEQVVDIENSLQDLMDSSLGLLLTQQLVFGVSFISMTGSIQILDVQLEWTGILWQVWLVE
jgi:hypothetical protein